MLRRNPEHLANPQFMKFAHQRFLLVAVNLVHGEKQRLPHALKLPYQFAIGPREFGAGIHDHDDSDRFLERNLCLPENFRRNKFLILRNDAARIDYSKRMAAPLRLAIEAVARDARLVADDRAPRTGQLVEQRGFANVGAPDDGEKRQSIRI